MEGLSTTVHNPSVDLNQMFVFATVVREGSFTGAARTLAMPKSTVSKRVAELESRLGVQLLQRSTRRLRLTDEGSDYYDRCRRIVADAEEADRTLAGDDGALRGLVRVSAPLSIGAHLGPLAAQFLTDHAHVSLELSLSDRRVDLIAEAFDLAIRVGPLRDSALVARRIGPASEGILCAAPTYLARHPAPRRPADLRRHECVVVRTAPGRIVWTFDRRGRTLAVPVTGRYAVSSMLLARDGALAGLGIASLPRRFAADDLRAGHLVQVLPEWPIRRGELHLLHAGGRSLAPAVRAFADLLIRTLTTPERGRATR
jgi:DNA-binding transcriptional LysR family regulator